MIDLAVAADFVRMHRDRTFVVKVGGACLARPSLVEALARQVAIVDACGARPVLVHGAGPQVDAVQRALGEEPRKVGGRRVTSDAALSALERCAREEVGPALAEALRRAGARPALVPGERVATARRRPPVATEEGPVDFGRVGDLVSVDAAALRARLAVGRVPIVAPPVAGEEGEGLLNANADLLAARVACALGADKLVLVSSVPGILTDPSDPATLVSTLALEDLDLLQGAGALRGGMAVKADAARLALRAGVPRVHVVSGTDPEALLGELYTTHGTGTLVTAAPEVAPV